VASQLGLIWPHLTLAWVRDQDGKEDSDIHVETLLLREIMALSLKSGVRVPLLQEVLQSAALIPGAQLVIELKPGSSDVTSLLTQLYMDRPELLPHTAVIMSFDLYLIHSVKQRYDEMRNADVSARPFDEIAHPKFLWLAMTVPPDPPEAEVYQLVDLQDVAGIMKYVKRENSELDGVYLEFNDSMLTPEGLSEIGQILSQCELGLYDIKPDNVATMERLVRAGVTYVNTDLPQTLLE